MGAQARGSSECMCAAATCTTALMKQVLPKFLRPLLGCVSAGKPDEGLRYLSTIATTSMPRPDQPHWRHAAPPKALRT